jgi:hypothetical protein
MVLQHARAVAHSGRADDVVARAAAQCLWASEKAFEVRCYQLLRACGCVLAHVGADTERSETQ